MQENKSSVSPEEIPGIDLLLYIFQRLIKAVCKNDIGSGFELLKIIDHQRSEEGFPVIQRWLIDNDRSALGLDALHDALNAALAEVVRIGLHGKAIDPHGDRSFFRRILHGAGRIVSGLVQHSVRNEILANPVALNNRLDQILRHILIDMWNSCSVGQAFILS